MTNGRDCAFTWGRGKTKPEDVTSAMELPAPDHGRLWGELAVFATGARVERTVLLALWRERGALDHRAGERLCADLVDLSILADHGLTVRLDPDVRAFLRARIAAATLTGVHAALVRVARRRLPPDGEGAAWWLLPCSEGYLWEHLPGHLLESGRVTELAGLLGDLRWLTATIRACGTAAAEADAALVDTDGARALARSLARSAHVLDRARQWDADPKAVLIPDQAELRAAEARDSLPSELVNQLRGVPELAPLLHTFVRSLPPRPRLFAHSWPPGTDPVPRRTILARGSAEAACVVAHDSSSLAGIGERVTVWEIGTGRVLADGDSSPIPAAVAEPDGSWLALISANDEAQAWDTATGTLRFAVPLTPGCRALLADGSWLAITDDRDRTVRVLDTREGTLLAVLAGHTDAIHGRAVSPDGTWLVTAGRDGTVRVWDTATWRTRHVLPESGTALLSSPDGTWLAAGDGDSTRIRDAATGSMRTRVPAFGAFAGASDGSWFATLDRFEAVLRVWDIPARHDSSVAAEPPQPPKRVDRARHTAAADPGWSPTVADDGHTVHLRDPATGQVWASLSGHATAVDKCVPTPGGSHVVTICADGVLRLWDTATRTVRTLLTGQESTQLCAVDPDGAWLATDSRDGDDAVIRLWDSATGHLLHTGRFYGQISELVAGPNGAWLAWRGTHATQRCSAQPRTGGGSPS
ncbi:WD40 repeat domain-containing protein [Streptomyces sp. NPDC021225]|uniref:WD40 repeat domain-containing protein n=1 Tax=Streptomyces sp. NPDC021225 TaxID=3365121 RepID=UPI0037BD3E68